MNLTFHQNAWEDRLYWLNHDKKVLKRVNLMIKEIERDPYRGIGKPEALRDDLAGWWSRRITADHRIVYRVQEGEVRIASLRYHHSK